LNLFIEQNFLCEASFELDEFQHEIVVKRDYIKFLQMSPLTEASPYFNFELFVNKKILKKILLFKKKASAGLSRGDWIDTSNLNLNELTDNVIFILFLQNFKIFITNDGYYSSEPLPEEWMDEFKKNF
jgi:hypothetical protein